MSIKRNGCKNYTINGICLITQKRCKFIPKRCNKLNNKTKDSDGWEVKQNTHGAGLTDKKAFESHTDFVERQISNWPNWKKEVAKRVLGVIK